MIIPVYNTEKYLRECIDSILNQTLKELEIILVDDGSDDGSWSIILEYSKKHQNISGYQQERKRQGAARNLALNYAKGEYVAFVDSDDIVPSDTYQKMYNIAVENNSEMVAGVSESFNDYRNWKGVAVHRTLFLSLTVNTNISETPELLSDISVCNRIIKKSLLNMLQLKFPEHTSGEDLDFMGRLYLHVNRITLIPDTVYNYRARPNARTGRISKSFFANRIQVVKNLKNYFSENGQIRVFKHLLHSEIKKLVQHRLHRVIKEICYEEQLKIFRMIKSLLVLKDDDELFSYNEFTYRERIRILLLKKALYDALIIYENFSKSDYYALVIEQNDIREKVNALVLLDRQNDASKSSKQYNKLKFLLKNPLKSREFVFSRLLNLPFFIFLFSLIIARIELLLRPIENDIWLFDERHASSAEDNAYYLFKHIRKNKPQVTAYYILAKSSAHWKKVQKDKNVVALYSLKHIYLLCKAKVLLSSDDIRYLAFPYFRYKKFLQRTHNVFLQHGVTAYKRNTYTKKNYPYFNQVICSGEKEKEIYIKENGFCESEVSVTGFSRFDNLIAQKNRDKKNIKILIAPTWRKWLQEGNQIQASKYFFVWKELLINSKLLDLLDKNHANVIFRPHFNMMPFIDEFTSNNKHVKISDKSEIPLQELIKECDLLITDYSSIIFDFFFQNKPAVAYIFDEKEMEAFHGKPYIPYDELPASLVKNLDQCILTLKQYFSNGTLIQSESQKDLEAFLAFRDSDNCERIYQSIIDRIENVN